MSNTNTNVTIPNGDDATELDLLTPNREKQTRFQVNRVRNESHNSERDAKDVTVNMSDEDGQTDDDEDHDLHSVTDKTRLNSDHAKSLRQVFLFLRHHILSKVD
ncbi:hypothetical protein NQ317_007191 [Molorchus minor]|uniref:Uncharacterized protein n=1 Tax=Molorchus minor TaxID=1323400 RepID=A0ABQ9J5Y4_9CUCU|nr:hypothetical protein NQ317_007191 [Molorchus minor]